MTKWFNTAGPCQPDIHYMLSPLARLPQLEQLIAQRGYFVIHAPGQTDNMDSLCLKGFLTMELLTKGLEQLEGYLAGLGIETGWLVIFDQRPSLVPIAERTTTEITIKAGQRKIVVVRGYPR